MELSVDENAPDFCLPDKDSQTVCLHDFKGKWVILYFYPKDNTRGCTLEAVSFSAHLQDFHQKNAAVLGVSPDSSKSHSNFAEAHKLKVTLLSDPSHAVLEDYGVWQLKTLYGREYYGVVRSTFLINPEGKIAHIWRNVRVENHVNIVKQTLSKLQKV